jgi:leucyl/phenylalanyl-tRNA--protein transferase
MSVSIMAHDYPRSTPISTRPLDWTAERRAELFRETASERGERIVLGALWPLKPQRIGGLPALARLWLADLFNPRRALPDPNHTLNAGGLCGMVHDLSVPTLLEAYRRGLFTFAHCGPLKWVSLPERCLLSFDQFHIGKQVRRLLRQGRYTVTFDRDFEGVIKACAGRREGKWHVTWITPRIMRAYADLYDAAHVHSFEVWNEAGALVGGGYGLAIGRAFFTESQFSHERNTSKMGFAVLNWHLAQWGYLLNDGKWVTPALLDVGFRPIPRAEFLRRLAKATREGGKQERWHTETELKTVAEWRPNPASAAPTD